VICVFSTQHCLGRLWCYLLNENENLGTVIELVCFTARDEIFDKPIEKLPQDDPQLVYYLVAKQYLNPPSENNHNLSNSTEVRSVVSDEVIKLLLFKVSFVRCTKNEIGSPSFLNSAVFEFEQTQGFFVECGVLDGERRSNTLDLEINYGWTV